MVGVVVKAIVKKRSKAKLLKLRRKRFKERAAMATEKLLSTNEYISSLICGC
jgi:hypothetical protein